MSVMNATEDLFNAGKKYFKFDIEFVNLACKKGNLPFLMCLMEKGILPTVEGANWASGNGHLDVLNWLEDLPQAVLPDTKGSELGVTRNAARMSSKWLSERGVLPNTYGANFACLNGHLDVLKWLLEKDILPNTKGANWFFMEQHDECIDILN